MSITRSADPKAPVIKAWRRDALVLWGHGIAGGPGVLERHANRIREHRRFRDVKTCCLAGEPRLKDTVGSIDARRIHLMPMLIAPGHTARVGLSAEIAGLGADASRLRIAPVIGQHPGFIELIANSARLTCRRNGWRPEETALLLAAHGSRRQPQSRKAVQRQAACLQRRHVFDQVAAAFLEDAPLIDVALAEANWMQVVVVGLFADAGGHGHDDVLAALDESSAPARYAGPIGARDEMVALVLDHLRMVAPDAAAA